MVLALPVQYSPVRLRRRRAPRTRQRRALRRKGTFRFCSVKVGCAEFPVTPLANTDRLGACDARSPVLDC